MKRASCSAVLTAAALACAACGAGISGTPGASGNPAASGATGTPPEPAASAAAAPVAGPATVPGPNVTASAPRAASSDGLTCAGLPTTAIAYDLPTVLGNAPLVAIQFVSAQRGWVAGHGRVLATSDAGQSWAAQYSGPANLDELDFIDAEHGWAVGPDTVLATSDGGATWTAAADPCAAIRSVHFVSPDLGFAVFGGTTVALDGGYPAVQDGGRLLRTEDGGHTWQVVPTAPASVQTACFSDPDDGFLATPGTIWRSTDGGLTWTAALTEPGPAEIAGVGPPAGPSQAAGVGAANATVVECAGSSGAWADVISVGAALGHKGYIAYSTQDGQHWHPLFAELYTESGLFPKGIQAGPSGYPGPFSAVSPDSAVYVGYSPPMGYGTATMTVVTGDSAVSDHGDVGGLTDPFGAAFLDTTRGWVVGEDQTQPGQWGDAVIEATTDGGRTWIRQYQVAGGH